MFVTVASVIRSIIADLTPAIGASGPHDFAVRFSRARQSQLSRPSLPDPRFVTNAHTPLWWDGMAIEVKLICLRDQARSYATHWHDGQLSKCVSRFICWSDVFFFPSPLVGEAGAKRRMRGRNITRSCDPSPVSNALCAFDPPSPTRGEGKEGRTLSQDAVVRQQSSLGAAQFDMDTKSCAS